MAKIVVAPGISQVRDWESLRRFTSIGLEAILNEVNGRLDFTNFKSAGPYTVTFAGSSDVQTLIHNLQKVPSGFVVVDLDAAITVYHPAAPDWDMTKVYLQASGAGTAKIWILG